MAYPATLREQEIKNRVAADFFGAFDCAREIGDIDFCVSPKGGGGAYMWAEAKAGVKADIYASFVQLIMTIGKARTFEKELPPPLLGAFDAEKMAFLPYDAVMGVFSQNDFNWNAAPNDHASKEFRQLYASSKAAIEANSYLFYYDDGARLKEFIKTNFRPDLPVPAQIEITRNNFVSVYFRWADTVKPSITVNWEGVKRQGIIDADFYLADLLSEDNKTIKQKLYVLLQSTYYQFAKRPNADLGYDDYSSAGFNDGQKAHQGFWRQYKRPPKEEFWDYIVEHRDLLVPQDVRERKGSYFTPRRWVELSQKYIADALGENWQDEYYIWDCAAGTGNLLAGLTDKYRIWASTLDQADVDVMLDRVANGANLLESHVFQFDFLNDPFDNLPAGLREIVEDPKKRKKLVVYINPPYAEADNRKGQGRHDVAISLVHSKYDDFMGYARREILFQFLARIYNEIQGCIIGNFSPLKTLQAPRLQPFRDNFQAKLKSLFIMPSNSFDNVSGNFSIGFFIWNTCEHEIFKGIIANIYNDDYVYIGNKFVAVYKNGALINDWIDKYRKKTKSSIGTMIGVGSDFQNQQLVRLVKPFYIVPASNHHWQILPENMMQSCIYYCVRRIIPLTWINNPDQFLFPSNSWEKDLLFQSDCLSYLLFADKNFISCLDGINNWIPFIESEVGAKDAYSSHFMTEYIGGKLGGSIGEKSNLYDEEHSTVPSAPLEFSPAAKAVFDAGRELWRYYHAQPGADPNAALYDIKAHFQGRDDKGRMNAKSSDEEYNQLMANLRAALKALAAQIEPKVYEHGFLKA